MRCCLVLVVRCVLFVVCSVLVVILVYDVYYFAFAGSCLLLAVYCCLLCAVRCLVSVGCCGGLFAVVCGMCVVGV